MLRILLIAIIVYFVLRMLQRFLASFALKPNNAKETKMVQCTHCGVHLPIDESYLTRGKYYCCSEHAQAKKGFKPRR